MDAKTIFLRGTNTFTLKCPFCGKEHVLQHKFHFGDECHPLTFDCVFKRTGKKFPRGKISFHLEHDFLIISIIPHFPIFKIKQHVVYWSELSDYSENKFSFEIPIFQNTKINNYLNSLSYLKAEMRSHEYQNTGEQFKLKLWLKIG